MPKSFFINDFQEEIWNDSYRHKKETIKETSIRQVEGCFQNEHDDLRQSLYNHLYSNKIVGGGRVIANVGTDISKVYPFNCYAIQRSVKPYDSIKNIFSDISLMADILKTEGGCGANYNHIRPKGTLIRGVGVGTPGVLSFMDIMDKVSEVITKGHDGEIFQSAESTTKKKIRKGAMISLLSVDHADILDYIEAKKIPNRLTKFNMSVIVSDRFMKTLLVNGDWDLWHPDINFEKYDDEWDGDFDLWLEKGYPRVIYKTMKAKALWDLLIKNCYNRNEPGIFFIDNANKYNNIKYYQKITAVNPCAELPMMGDSGIFEYNGILYPHMGDICNLGSLNLPKFYNGKEFDYNGLGNAIRLLNRMLDNLIDTSGYPLEGLKNAAFLRRKIGMGVMGYGSLLYMMGLKYGSPEANLFTETLGRFMANTAYMSSVELAKEKGSFPLFDKDKIMQEGFIFNSGVLENSTLDAIKQYGLRNCQLLTIAPNGTTSIFAGLVSGGVEPVFEREYYRWVTSNHNKHNILSGLNYPDYSNGEWKETDDFKFAVRGDEEVLVNKDKTLMIDKNRGLTRKQLCEDYGWGWVKKNRKQEWIDQKEKEGVFSTAMELSVPDHIEPFKIWSKHVDNAISKTVNLSSTYPIDDFSAIFIDAWKSGVRGLTTYREGTMTAVLESKKDEKKNEKSIKKEQKEFFDIWKKHDTDGVVIDDVELPDEYPSTGFVIKSEGKKWYLSLAFKDRGLTRPFAIFVKTNHREPTVNINNAVQLLNELAVSSGLREELINKNIEKIELEANYNKLSRMLSFLLRHNVPIINIIKCLEQIDGIGAGHFVYRITKFLYKFVDDVVINEMSCPTCGEPLRRTEGCINCTACSFSKC